MTINNEFLKAIFINNWKTAHVTSFPDDPNNIEKRRKGICWAGHYADISLEKGNQYFTISRFKPLNGKPVRRKAQFIAMYVVVADDIREKLPIEQVKKLPTPSYKLLTSQNSEQWGWILSTPCVDRSQAENLLDGLVSHGLAPDGKDPGMRGVTRYVRLPDGYNSKSNRLINGEPFQCQLIEFYPWQTVSMEELANPFNVDLFAKRKDTQIDGASEINHPMKYVVNIKSVISDGRYDITCPWISEHTDEQDDGTAIFSNTDLSIGFKCHHGHCQDKTGKDLIEWIDKNNPGWSQKLEKWKILKSLGVDKNINDIDICEKKNEMINPDKYFSGKTFIPSLLADEIIEENNILNKPNDSFYQYIDGVWINSDDMYIKEIIDTKLDYRSSKKRIEDVFALISIRIYEKKELNYNRNFLNLKNGMFSLQDYSLLPHEKKYLSAIRLDVNYDEQAECLQWKKFLSEVLSNDQELINIMQEFFGYCLTTNTNLEKMLILVGDGANGKSTLLSVLTKLIGQPNISTISLSDFEKEFFRINLYKKLVNISTEFEIKKLLSTEYFKKIVSGEPISACHKFKDIITFTPFTKLIVAMNDLPTVKDKSSGYYRRLIIIPFQKQFLKKDADRKLKDKLINERDGIFLWALKGLKRLNVQDGFSESKETDKLVADYKKNNNPVSGFIDEFCIIDKKEIIPKRELYKKYISYCSEYAYMRCNNINFSKELKRLIPDVGEYRTNNIRCWIGIYYDPKKLFEETIKSD